MIDKARYADLGDDAKAWMETVQARVRILFEAMIMKGDMHCEVKKCFGTTIPDALCVGTYNTTASTVSQEFVNKAGWFANKAKDTKVTITYVEMVERRGRTAECRKQVFVCSRYLLSKVTNSPPRPSTSRPRCLTPSLSPQLAVDKKTGAIWMKKIAKILPGALPAFARTLAPSLLPTSGASSHPHSDCPLTLSPSTILSSFPVHPHTSALRPTPAVSFTMVEKARKKLEVAQLKAYKEARVLGIPTRELSQSLHPANHEGACSLRVARSNPTLTGAQAREEEPRRQHAHARAHEGPLELQVASAHPEPQEVPPRPPQTVRATHVTLASCCSDLPRSHMTAPYMPLLSPLPRPLLSPLPRSYKAALAKAKKEYFAQLKSKESKEKIKALGHKMSECTQPR